MRRINKSGDVFNVETNGETVKAKHVIWSAGDFQYSNMTQFAGSQHCRHIAMVNSYEGLAGDDFIIIGGYESGVDAAFHLSHRDKRVRIFDKNCPWAFQTSDPSVALSTYTLERMGTEKFNEHVSLYPDTSIQSVTRSGDVYEVLTGNGQTFHTRTQPLMAEGFRGSHILVEALFENGDNGFPLLNESDESTITPGLFLCGPSVSYQRQVFFSFTSIGSVLLSWPKP